MNAGNGGNFKLLQIVQRRVGEPDVFRQKFGGTVVWESENEGIGGFFPAAIEDRCLKRAIFETKAAGGRAKNCFAALFFDGGAAAVIEFRQWHRRDAHSVACAIGEKCFPENVDAEAGVAAVEFFIECADQDHTPETFDRGRRLFAAPQPFQHRDRPGAIRIFRAATGKENGGERTGNRKFVPIRKRRKKKKRAGHVGSSGKKNRFHYSRQALWGEKNQAAKGIRFHGGSAGWVKSGPL